MATDKLEHLAAGMIESTRKHAEVVGLSEHETSLRCHLVEGRVREQLGRWRGHAFESIMMNRGALDLRDVWTDSEIETIVRAGAMFKEDDREVAWQVISAIREGYPTWTFVTCQPQPRTVGPETREVYERRLAFERELPRIRAEMTAAFVAAAPELLAKMREANTPAVY